MRRRKDCIHLALIAGAITLAFAAVSFALLECDGTFRALHREIASSGGWEATEVRPGLYIGSIHSASDWDGLQAHGITAVLNAVAIKFRSKFPDRFERLDLFLLDRKEEDILTYLPITTGWLMEQLRQGQTVLVHCEEGRSRSVSVVIAYLMAVEKLSFKAAKNDISDMRRQAKPNKGFKKQLHLYGDLLATHGSGMRPEVVTPDLVAKYNAGQGNAIRGRNRNHSMRGAVSDSVSPVVWPVFDWTVVVAAFLVLVAALVRIAGTGAKLHRLVGEVKKDWA